MASYNTTRFVEDLLENTASLPPSFTVHLHLEHWTLNNGSKFLYNNQIASLLDDVRAHRIPVDFLDLFEAAKVPFYDGCMIVELLDYRPQRGKEPPPDKPERTRVVLHPNSETLWADICAMNHRFGGKWSDRDALEVEARLLLATSPPLCLDPDPHLARVANHVMRVSTPTVPTSLKRKATNLDPAEDETDKARRAKIMSFMNSRQNRAAPSYRMLDAMQKWREKKANPDRTSTPASTQAAPSPTKSATPSITVSQAQSPVSPEKARGPTPAPTTPAFPRASGSVTPVPQPSTHQFINATPTHPSTPSMHSPMLPQVYPNVKAATEAAKRTPTPAQIKQYAHSPQLPPGVPATVPAPVSVSVPVQQQTQSLQPCAANPTFQPPAPFFSQPTRGGMPKAAPQNNGVKLHPQYRQQNFATYAERQSQAHAVMMAQRAAQQNGRATPAQLSVGQNVPTAAPVTRSSPMALPKSLGVRSPMPPATQLPTTQQQQQQIVQQALAMQQQQQPHPAQHPQHTFSPSYNPAQLRPGMVHGSPQLHLAAAAAQAQAQAQAQGQRPPSAAGIQQQQQQGMYIPPQMYGYTAAMNFAQSQQMTPQMQQRMFQYQARMNGQVIPQQIPTAKAAATGGMQGR
ncbi:hypothetical protein J132_02709 [Termitomyces sp. J132]|nr:hypothetical protein H2248_010410 [Termitomyces sp. 'cryptogamus']KNZ72551.1 hypothetical protein J132_02709 [Termitomyces sp. J132]